MLGFMVVESPDKVKTYVVDNNRVTCGYEQHKSPEGRWGCTCAMFRLKGACLHSKAASTEKWGSMLWVGIFPSGESQEFFAGDVGLLKSEGTGDFALHKLPTFEKEDVRTIDVLNAMAEGHPLQVSNSGFDISPRIVSEIRESFAKSLTLIDSGLTVVAVKRKGDPLPKAKKAAPEPEAPKSSRPPAPWESVPVPEGWWVDKDVWQSILCCTMDGGNILLLGPKGAGKSELAYHVAKALKMTIEPFNFGAMQEPRLSLIGNTTFSKEEGTLFHPSRFINAIRKESSVVLLDELTRSGRDASNILIPLLDRQGYLALDETEKDAMVYKADKVTFLGTANIGYQYTGTDPLDAALFDRFDLKIELGYPPPQEEFRIIHYRYPKAPKATIEGLIDAANIQRSMSINGDFEIMISTRMLMDAAKYIERGLPVKNAVKFVLLGCFSSDGGAESERIKVAQIFQKSGRGFV